MNDKREMKKQEIDILMRQVDELVAEKKKTKSATKAAELELRINELNREINRKIRFLKLPSISSLVERVKDFFDDVKHIATSSEQAVLRGRKIRELRAEREEQEKEFVQVNRDEIIEVSSNVAREKKSRGERIDMAKFITAMVGSAILGFGLAHLGDRTPIQTMPENSVTTYSDPEEGQTTQTTITQTVSQAQQASETPAQTTAPQTTAPVTQQQEPTVTTESSYVVDLNNVYEEYEVNNPYGFINFRNNPTTNASQSEVLEVIQGGNTIYVQSNSEATADSAHDWRSAMYFSPARNTYIEGFVDANLLERNNDIDNSIVVKDNSIEESDGQVDENELHIQKHEIEADILRVRETPTTEVSNNIVAQLPNGANVYTFNDGQFQNTDENHEWVKALYYDGSVYKSGYLDANYISEEIPIYRSLNDRPANTIQETTTTTSATTTTTTAAPITQSVNERPTTSAAESISNATPTVNTQDDWEIFAKYPGYTEYLKELKQQHPNWVFKAYNTGVDFQSTVDAHYNKHSVTVPGSWSQKWFYQPKTLIDSGEWYAASRDCVSAMMDPRNFINEVQVFQFEDTDAAKQYVTLDDVKNAFSTVGWANKEKFSYMNTNKEIVTLDKSFAELVYEISREYDFNPLFAASSIINEQGNGEVPDSKTGKGTIPGYEGLYNYGNIGAFADSQYSSAGERGLVIARQNGWTTPEAAIRGYVEFTKNKFINEGRYCKYLTKFQPESSSPKVYMTALTGAYNAAVDLYKNANKDQVHVFRIPVYENMPSNLCQLPAEPGMAMYNVNGGIANRGYEDFEH